MELSSNMKGAIAEQAILLAAVKLGVPVTKPVAEHSRCDLAFGLGDRIWRVQVKWGRLSEAGDVVIVQLRTSRLTPRSRRRFAAATPAASSCPQRPGGMHYPC
jgi:hypothetical protein